MNHEDVLINRLNNKLDGKRIDVKIVDNRKKNSIDCLRKELSNKNEREPKLGIKSQSSVLNNNDWCCTTTDDASSRDKEYGYDVVANDNYKKNYEKESVKYGDSLNIMKKLGMIEDKPVYQCPVLTFISNTNPIVQRIVESLNEREKNFSREDMDGLFDSYLNFWKLLNKIR